jgi:hypothetical protein
MATYDNLPVYKTSYDLLFDLFRACQNMERDYKFTIGENLKKEVIELIKNVYRANSRNEKSELLAAGRENAEVIRLLLRILRDLKQVKTETLVNLNEKLESISKQLAAWQKKSGTSVTQADLFSSNGATPHEITS